MRVEVSGAAMVWQGCGITESARLCRCGLWKREKGDINEACGCDSDRDLE